MDTVYSDGSRLDGPSSLLARNGWAFVVISGAGELLAAANGLSKKLFKFGLGFSKCLLSGYDGLELEKVEKVPNSIFPYFV